MISKKFIAAVTSAVILTGISANTASVQAATEVASYSSTSYFTPIDKVGIVGDHVTQVQNMMKTLGYTVIVDGEYDITTARTLNKFKVANKLIGDGVVDLKTYNLLTQAVDYQKSKAEAYKSNTDASGFATIDTVGMTGETVTIVQNMLKALGYTVVVDGEYDITTARTVNKFKVANKLVGDGVVDLKTYNLLVQAVKSVTGKDITELKVTADKVNTVNGTTEETTESTDTQPILIDRVGVTGEKVTEVQQMLNKLSYSVIIDGEYDITTARTVNRFKQAKVITPYDGKVDQKTFEALINAVESKERTALTVSRGQAGGAVAYDWYKQVNTNIFPIMSIAKVTDIYSGKSFMIQRTYGYNHADVEALTYDDAMIIKSAVGGTWNWDRRPVIVETNGYRIAASMTSMPHAGRDDMKGDINVPNRSEGYGYGPNLEKIQGNGQDGHFDIHFLNSRRHFDNAVDTKHQLTLRSAIGR